MVFINNGELNMDTAFVTCLETGRKVTLAIEPVEFDHELCDDGAYHMTWDCYNPYQNAVSRGARACDITFWEATVEGIADEAWSSEM